MIDFDPEIEEIWELAYNIEEIRVINKQVSEGKEIVIFGTGNCGHSVWRSLADEGIKVKAFCDNQLAGIMDRETSLPIIGVMQMAILIKKITTKYKLYMRHYSDHFAETVCYAI